jgi:phospholipid/cholesterol/gamma-HCH transport system substrate-binding protein
MILRRRPASRQPKYGPADEIDPRIFGRHYRGPRPAKIGFVVAVVGILGMILAFTKHVPFTGHGYELHATFRNAATLTPNSPVRIAGVNVGEVTSVEAKGNVAQATFTVTDQGLPIHRDATVTIRPRLFLEGNFFLDLHPGSPGAPDVPSGSNIGITQTGTAVQLDQVLTALQRNTRTSLQHALKGFGTALTRKPTAAEDAAQDPAVRGETAAQAIKHSFRYGGTAGRTWAITNEALLGEHPHDLSNLVRGQRNVMAKLAATDGSLSDLISNLNTTSAALASQSANLASSLRELAPTLEVARPSLQHLNDALPPLRALAIELRPGIRQLPATIRAGSPWLVQVRKLLRRRELGGDARLLAQAAPPLAGTVSSAPALLNQAGLTSRCIFHNLVPLGNEVVDDAGGAYPFSTGQPNSREFLYTLTQLAGESQGFDGNGSFVRFQAGGGPQLVRMPNPGGGFQAGSLWGHNIAPPLGTRPRLPAQGKPPFRMDVPCYTQAVPNLNGPAGAVAPPDPRVHP